uniref:Diphosphomevalonate decarboxylase n=1 Tax=Caenorhabditis tropicalis TaxID=1561998 RepID=A0A1I7TSE9_9PELO
MPQNGIESVTVRVPMNIALVKYWGKRDEKLILPLNDSISLTVDKLTAETTVRMIPGVGKNTVEINGKQVELNSNKRYETVFEEALRLQRKRKDHSDSNGNQSVFYHFEVISKTNFPVAAGLASSAAGFAAIALGIQRLLNLDDVQANRLARIGSGSACRSMFGGLVHWKKGEKEDGSDCVAVKTDESNWTDLYCIILVFNDGRKKVGSSEGMKRTRETSTLLKYRIESIVPKRIEQIKEAYSNRNFETLAHVIMADSNQFHAVCLDSVPPIRYLNDASWQLIEIIEKFNENETRAAYTFDAGPNACVIVQKKDAKSLIYSLLQSIEIPSEDLKSAEEELKESFEFSTETPKSTVCSKLVISPMGGGPQD